MPSCSSTRRSSGMTTSRTKAKVRSRRSASSGESEKSNMGVSLGMRRHRQGRQLSGNSVPSRDEVFNTEDTEEIKNGGGVAAGEGRRMHSQLGGLPPPIGWHNEATATRSGSTGGGSAPGWVGRWVVLRGGALRAGEGMATMGR